MPVKYVAIGAVVLIIIAAVYAFFSYAGTNPPEAPTEENVSEESPEADTQDTQGAAGAFSGSLADLAIRGGNWQCTFDAQNDIAHSDGVVYVSGEKIRGDFQSQIPQLNQTVDSHMIQSDGYVYVWTSLSPQGFKTETALGTEDATTKFSDQGVDINQRYAYNCTPWAADASKFVLPSDVTFIE